MPLMFLVSVLALVACTPLSMDLAQSQVVEQVRARGRPAQAVDLGQVSALVAELCTAPLTADSTMQIALINNPEIRAHYAKLGIAAAEVYRAGRIRNPIFFAEVLESNRSDEVSQNTYGLIASLSDLITLPARKRLAAAEFAIVQREVGAELLDLAAWAEAAFYRFVAAKQVAVMRAQVAKAVNLSRQLARRYFEAGNLTPREMALEEAAAEAQIEVLQAEYAAFTARTEMATSLGLSVADGWDVRPQLAILVAREDELRDLLLLARESRLDLAAATARAERLAEELRYSNWRRWLGELGIGVERERETDGSDLTGPILGWEIPIFTQHRDQLLVLDAELQAAISEVARLLLDSDSGVRLAHAGTQNARSRVEVFRTQLLPARMEAVAQAQLEENFMPIGTFELLLSKQREYDAYQGYLEALGDYWIMRAALAEAVGRRLPSSDRRSVGQANVEELLRPPAGMHGDTMRHAGGHMGRRPQSEMYKDTEKMLADEYGQH